MIISKGRSNCEAERDLVIQGFCDLIEVSVNAKRLKEDSIKGRLYDIITDRTLSEEERLSLQHPLEDELAEQEEQDIRIRRSVLIGIYSFWELSLLEMVNHYNLPLKKAKKKENGKKKEIKGSASDYLNSIFENPMPANMQMIDSELKEFRNYMTHGSIGVDRKAVIDKMIANHSEFDICQTIEGYHLSSYNGLIAILNLLEEALEECELVAKNKKTNTPKK